MIAAHGSRRSEAQGRSRRRRRRDVVHLLPGRRSRRSRVSATNPRPRQGRDLRRGLLPALARAAAEPRGARGPPVAARGSAAAGRADRAVDEAAAGVRRHGHAADVDLGARPVRSRSERRVPAGAIPQGGSPDGADGHHRCQLRPPAGRRRIHSAGSGAQPRGELPLHAERGAPERPGDARVRRRARAARGSRTERLDVRGPGLGGDADRHLFGDGRRHRRAEGAAARRRQRRRDAAADRDRPGGDAGADRRGDPSASSRAR